MDLTVKGWVAIALLVGGALSLAEGRPATALLLASFIAALWWTP